MRKVLSVTLALCAFLALPAYGSVVAIESYDSPSFNLGREGKFEIPVTATEKGMATVSLYSPDGDLVRTLKTQPVAPGKPTVFMWDGKDEKGSTVPNEAYIPKVKFQGKGDAVVFDPSKNSGGEIIDSITPDFSNRGGLTFTLDHPSRVLVRAGLKSGPLMKTMVNWEPRLAGKNRVSWNGFDGDNIVNLSKDKNLGVLVTGFELPQASIIAVGSKTDYRQWRAGNGWGDVMPDMRDVSLVRDEDRLSRHYFLPRSAESIPDVSVSFSDGVERLSDSTFKVTGDVTVNVNMSNDEAWAMAQSQYEIGFFVDGKFIAEEEQGYVPLSWRFNPDFLEPGEHVFTVNVSSFNGAVAIKSLKIVKP